MHPGFFGLVCFLEKRRGFGVGKHFCKGCVCWDKAQLLLCFSHGGWECGGGALIPLIDPHSSCPLKSGSLDRWAHRRLSVSAQASLGSGPGSGGEAAPGE